jgi:hypothetical protein
MIWIRGKVHLTDFEPSEESLRLVSVLKQRMPLIAGEIEVRHMVNAIKSYEWRGLKKKIWRWVF